MAKTWQPLKGIKVLSFELAFALPAATRALHDLGAEVVRVSPPARQVDRYIGYIDGVFQGKSSVSIDLTKPAGQALAQRLAGEADVVCNNFRPGVLEKYGLGANALRRSDPALITLQVSGYGTPGPWSRFPAFGPSTEAAGGLNRLLADEGEVPVRVGSAVFSDQLAGRYSVLAVLAALVERNKTGTGAALDLSMTASITHMLGQPMTQAYLQGKTPAASKNRDPRFVPQGVYQCASARDNASGSAKASASCPTSSSTDEWIAISVANGSQWRALALALNESELAALAAAPLDACADLAARMAAHDLIDTALQEYCARSEKNTLADKLQALGVPAAPVRTTSDQALDPNVISRGSLQLLKHTKPVLGYRAHPHAPLPWRVVGRRRRALSNYRHTGSDNERVLQRWLNMGPGEMAELKSSAVLYVEPPKELRPRRKSKHHDANHGVSLGLPK